MTTRVVWISEDTHWDHFVREWTAGDDYEHSVGTSRADDGAVVVIPGQHHVEDALTLADQLAALPWSLTIVTSDEEGLFPLDQLPRDARHATWNQYHSSPFAERVIPIGPAPGTEKILAERLHPPRTNAVSFAGQDTHQRRHELLDVIKEMACDVQRYGDVGWFATTGFRAGLTQVDYLDAMLNTRIAPCPSGPHSLDSFRLYEAIEAGALPVIERCTPHGDEAGFWLALFDWGCPIPLVESWAELPALVERFGVNGPMFQEKRDEVRDWYRHYRAGLALDFKLKIAELQS